MTVDAILASARKGVEELSHDPRVQLELLNARILMLELQIFAEIDELQQMKNQRRELIREVLK